MSVAKCKVAKCQWPIVPNPPAISITNYLRQQLKLSTNPHTIHKIQLIKIYCDQRKLKCQYDIVSNIIYLTRYGNDDEDDRKSGGNGYFS
jgi:hypothetical protein